MRIEYHVLEVRFVDDNGDEVDFHLRFVADTEQECLKWIDDHLPPESVRSELSYTIQKIYTNRITRDV